MVRESSIWNPQPDPPKRAPEPVALWIWLCLWLIAWVVVGGMIALAAAFG